MFSRFRHARAEYPSQYWLLFWGMLISTTGASMIWPFLMLYVSKTLALPLSSVAWLMTLNSGIGLISSFIAGPITDRFGRKWVMVVSLLANGLVFLLYTQAHTLPAFALVGALSGLANPVYRVGANAMLADLVPGEKRADAFALIRLSNNVGVALGPAIGGFLASTSYNLAFLCAAIGMIIYSLLMTFKGRETLPSQADIDAIGKEPKGGYERMLRDKPFLAMVASLTFTITCAGIMWVLLAVYTNTQFNIPERAFGWMPTVNALMVVFLQVAVTSRTKRFSPLLMMALGSLFYAIGVGSVALGQTYWAFMVSMMVMTIGELILVPTSDSYVASLAPVDMRGRYMSVSNLTWNIGSGIGPVIGGYLNDAFNPAAIWVGAFVLGMIGALGFVVQQLKKWTRVQEATAPAD